MVHNPSVLQTFLAAAAAYALGCLVGGYYVVRIRTGRDVRSTGSGNAGARNVLRSGDRVGAMLTLAWDILKGALAVWMARWIAQTELAAGTAFIAAVAGHIWPAQLRFRGGKGAATALGCMLAVDARAAVAACALGMLTGGARRSATVGGLTAVATAPVMLLLVGGTWMLSALVGVACAAVLLVHHPSIDRRRHAALMRPVRENA